MICPECGTQNELGQSTCTGCGGRLQTTGGGVRKGLAIASLGLGIVSLPTLGCLGIGAIVAIVLGIVAIVKARREPHTYGGAGIAIGGIVCAALSLVVGIVVAIISAIAIPSLLRARMAANESSAIGDLRTVISAEYAYSLSNEGFFDTLECLQTPAVCGPGQGEQPMIDASIAYEHIRRGYRWTFHPGPAAVPSDPSSVSPTSMTAFAYVGVPVKPGNTGRRAFCGDATGSICSTPDGSEPLVIDGACDLAACSPMM